MFGPIVSVSIHLLQETQLSYLFVEMPNAGWFFIARNDPAMAHQIGVLPVVPPTIALAHPSGSRTGEVNIKSVGC